MDETMVAKEDEDAETALIKVKHTIRIDLIVRSMNSAKVNNTKFHKHVIGQDARERMAR
jgi:hypothetical protein